mmetsp:Transcript_21787/g.32574  ORF Transcript_21787/g.32574 Transcript_21787/m.32574 type:complete len:891 (-) Transcript_21787:80-2752(-)|eukprot:CAMPEP_0116030898 /NCGR_PEP_ID=MMETSP0321-20121206/17155_1 /TAXON_ID=163516 /ORGANISM="Leptocylindrus danicus var. danicus, Strain B650" /LENGTH=890 /DNA_ID=CAMNT_0003505845 /DNA_START=17 /DNA_END=2689 /DNA_ORIENTATION=-
MRYSSAALALFLAAGVSAKKDVDSSSNPPFFLQDTLDGMCLAGGVFKRCSIDTIFNVVGSPGSYTIHKRLPASDEEKCVSKESCDKLEDDGEVNVMLAPCTHCGAKKWNIMGETSSGFLVTEGDDGELCLSREAGLGSQAKMVPCKEDPYPNYTIFSLQFVTQNQLEIMESPISIAITHAEDGDLAELKKLLDEDKELVSGKDWDDYTLLQAAAFEGQSEVVEYLLGLGADANEADQDGITALMKASIRGHFDVVKILVEAGAEVDATAKSDITAAWLAAGEGKHEVLAYLLEKGADAKVKRSDGVTPLINACTGTGEGQVEVIQLLLDEYKGDLDFINAQDTDGLSAMLQLTESETTLPAIQLLAAAGADINVVTAQGYTPLIIASAHGWADIVAWFIENGADVDHQAADADGSTAIMYAGTAGHVDTVKKLIAAGANVNLKHNSGGTALSESAAGGNVEIVEAILGAGADPSTADNSGITVLMMAASVGNIDICKRIIEANNDSVDYVNQSAENGGFALMFAAGSGHTDAVKFLMDKGANPAAVVEASADYITKLAELVSAGRTDVEEHVDNLTALHVAAQGGHKATCQVILDAAPELVNLLDSDGRSPLILAVKSNYGSTATLLLENGADPNVAYKSDDETQRSHNLLMDSLIVENEKFATLLIEKGASLDYVDVEGGNVSLLLQAAHRGLSKVVDAMLPKLDAAAIASASDEGITPLIAAASEGHVEVLEALVAKGADVNAADKDGTNALMAACARGHTDLVRAMLKVPGVELNQQNTDGHTALMFAYNGKNQVETLWERYVLFLQDQEESGDEVDKDDATGTRIKESLDKHSELVKELIAAGADESLKDKEGHVAKDFDFVPESELNEEVLEAEKKRKSKSSDEL